MLSTIRRAIEAFRYGRWPMSLLRRNTRSLKVLCASLLVLLCSAPKAQAQRWHATAMSQPTRELAQPLQDLAHMSWTWRNGAPSDITALAQTRDGYLWIGSRLGLFRFDGLQFSAYPFTAVDPQLPSSDISALAAAPDGGLWIGYRMGGITYLNGNKKIDYAKSSGLIDESTEQLVCRPDGSVWATADGRLMHLVGSRWVNYSATHGLPSDGLYSMFFDRDGNLWTGYKGGIAELERGASNFQLTALPGGQVNQFAQTPDGTIWISDAWKNVRPLADQRRALAVRIPGVPLMLVDNEGSIWLAQDFGGVTRIQNPGRTDRHIDIYSVANGLTDGQTGVILQDRDGAIWVGTARGLDRFQPSPLVQFRGVHLDYYPALAADSRGGIWFNDMDKPLMRLRNGQLTFEGRQAHGSSSLYRDPTGTVWLVDPITHDLYGYPPNGGAPTRIPAPALSRDVETWCIGEDAGGAMLVGVEGHGLWRYSGGSWQRVLAPGLPSEPPLSLMCGAGDRLWLGYAHDEVVLKDASGYHFYGSQQGLAINSVFTFLDANGLVLAGGSDGLSALRAGAFHSLHLRTPSLLRGISGIVQDRWGDLWLNAASGVVHLPAAEWQAGVRDPSYAMDYQLFSEQDGLIGTPAQGKPAPSAVVDSSGRLWFATSGHLFSIDPASVRRELPTPNVLLQAILLNGVAVRYQERVPIVVASQHLRTLEFDYIGVDLDAPDRVSYQYMLEGQDKEWQDVGSRRQAFYTNLAPRGYVFRVRAAIGTGRWSNLQLGLPLTVKPAFYQTTWFTSLCLVLLAALLWLLYRLRLQSITSKMKVRSEERAQERIRIARDLHDTLLQGVQGLMLRFHFATEQLSADEPARAQLFTALERADQVIGEGREKVRELRAEGRSPQDLGDDLRDAAKVLQAESGARISLTVKGEPRSLYGAVQEELYNIGREALTNAVRHAEANHIELKLTYEAAQLQLQCADDGKGISARALQAVSNHGHWGIVGMRERAMRLSCKLELSSTPGRGTVLQVSVSARRAYAKSANPRRWKLLAQLAAPIEK